MRSKTILEHLWNGPRPRRMGRYSISHPDGALRNCSIILFTRVLEQWNTPRTSSALCPTNRRGFIDDGLCTKGLPDTSTDTSRRVYGPTDTTHPRTNGRTNKNNLGKGTDFKGLKGVKTPPGCMHIARTSRKICMQKSRLLQGNKALNCISEARR